MKRWQESFWKGEAKFNKYKLREAFFKFQDEITKVVKLCSDSMRVAGQYSLLQ